MVAGHDQCPGLTNLCAPQEWPEIARDADGEFIADFDRQASATNSVYILGLSPPT